MISTAFECDFEYPAAMKNKLKEKGDALKGLIKTGGDVMDKALEKSCDVLTIMMNNMTGLISKLSDDIGSMADRILAMEERIGKMADRIGLMADRIVHTEELMAKLTATLADKDFDPSLAKRPGKEALQPPELIIPATSLSAVSFPELRISGDPDVYLLYVSANPLFREDATVVTRITGGKNFESSWRRSVKAIRDMEDRSARSKSGFVTVSIAVKTISDHRVISPLSNSIDITVHG
jgi:hypothetical protein